MKLNTQRFNRMARTQDVSEMSGLASYIYKENINLYNLLNSIKGMKFPEVLLEKEFENFIHNRNYRPEVIRFINLHNKIERKEETITDDEIYSFFNGKTTNELIDDIVTHMFINLYYILQISSNTDKNNFYCKVENTFNTFRIRVYDCTKEKVNWISGYDELTIPYGEMNIQERNNIYRLFKKYFIGLLDKELKDCVDDSVNIFKTEEEKKIGKNSFNMDTNNSWEMFTLESDESIEEQVSQIVSSFRKSFKDRVEARNVCWVHIHVNEDKIDVNFEGYNSHPPEIRLLFDVSNLSSEEINRIGDTIYQTLGGRSKGEYLTYSNRNSHRY